MSLTQQIIDTLPVNVVLGYYILGIKTNTGEKMYLSPFKQENTPSLSGSDSKKIWKDFSTGKGGNVISFVMELKKLSFIEAVEELNNTFNLWIQLRELSPEEKEREAKKKAIIDGNRKMVSLLSENLWKEETNIYNILKKKFVTEKSIGIFRKDYLDIVNAEINFEIQWNFIPPEWDGRYVLPIYSSINSPIGFMSFSIDEGKINITGLSEENYVFSHKNFLYNIENLNKEEKEFFISDIQNALLLQTMWIENMIGYNKELSYSQLLQMNSFNSGIILTDKIDTPTKTLAKDLISIGVIPYISNISNIADQEEKEAFLIDNKKEYILDVLLSQYNKTNSKEILKEINALYNSIPLEKQALKFLYKEALWDLVKESPNKNDLFIRKWVSPSLDNYMDFSIKEIVTLLSTETSVEVNEISLQALYNYVVDRNYMDIFEENMSILGPIATQKFLALSYDTSIEKQENIDWLEDAIINEEKIKIC